MESLDNVRKVLIHRKRSDLSNLLTRASVNFNVSSTYGTHLFSLLTTAEIYAPIEDCDRLRSLSQEDQILILKALREIYPPKDHEIEIIGVEYYLDADNLIDEMTDDKVVQEIEAQRNLMISVATGCPRIDEVNVAYKERRERIRNALQRHRLNDPNPHSDLWAWYGKWSSGDLPTYQSRRRYISELYSPLLERLKSRSSDSSPTRFEEPTGWSRVDRGLIEIRERLAQATTEEQYQAVGLLCREVLISLAQIVYDPARHPTVDGVGASDTDAKRMLEAYLAEELASSSNEVARRHARASLDLANTLQHQRTATFRLAALCAEATTSVVNLIAIISGQRNP